MLREFRTNGEGAKRAAGSFFGRIRALVGSITALVVLAWLAACESPKGAELGATERKKETAVVPNPLQVSPEICRPLQRNVPSPKQVDAPCQCGRVPEGLDARILKIEYVLKPPVGTFVRILFPNGCVHGGNVLTESPIGAIDEHGCVSEACARVTWQLAKEVLGEAEAVEVPEGPIDGYASLAIEVAPKRFKGAKWIAGEKAPTERMNKLVSFIDVMGIGAR